MMKMSWTTSKRPRTPFMQLLNVPERPESVYRAEACYTSVARVGRYESLKWSGGRTCMRAVATEKRIAILGMSFTREPLNWKSPLKISLCYLYMLNHNFGIKLILHGTTYSCHLARTILNKDTAGKFSQHAATTKIMSPSGRQKLYGVTSL